MGQASWAGAWDEKKKRKRIWPAGKKKRIARKEKGKKKIGEEEKYFKYF